MRLVIHTHEDLKVSAVVKQNGPRFNVHLYPVSQAKSQYDAGNHPVILSKDLTLDVTTKEQKHATEHLKDALELLKPFERQADTKEAVEALSRLKYDVRDILAEQLEKILRLEERLQEDYVNSNGHYGAKDGKL